MERCALVIRIGVRTLAHAVTYSEWANQYESEIGDYLRNFAITDADVFAHDVRHAMLSEREDGSTPLTDFIDRMTQAAVEDGSEATDEASIKHGETDQREEWSWLHICQLGAVDEGATVPAVATPIDEGKADPSRIEELQARLHAQAEEIASLTAERDGYRRELALCLDEQADAAREAPAWMRLPFHGMRVPPTGPYVLLADLQSTVMGSEDAAREARRAAPPCPKCRHAWHDAACSEPVAPGEVSAFPMTCGCQEHEDREDREAGLVSSQPAEPDRDAAARFDSQLQGYADGRAIRPPDLD
jgi:hypothetical protein